MAPAQRSSAYLSFADKTFTHPRRSAELRHCYYRNTGYNRTPQFHLAGTPAQTIMQRILCLTLLLVCAMGCTKPQESVQAYASSGGSFNVDGIWYYGQLSAAIGRQRHVVSSSIVIWLNSERQLSTRWSATPHRTLVVYGADEEKTVIKADTLYFFQEGKVAWGKAYRELGIESEKLTVPVNINCDYLQPILEKLIRENVKSQETEMEVEP
jgi:hypothetical protein